MSECLSDVLAEVVDDLVATFNDAPVLTTKEVRRRRDEHRERVHRQFVDEGRSAFGTPTMYMQDRESFDVLIKSTGNDLRWQCQTVAAAFIRYLEIGEIPAPYFPMRVAIILRKAKEHARERAFLAAWCRHFRQEGKGATYRKLDERAAKLGV